MRGRAGNTKKRRWTAAINSSNAGPRGMRATYILIYRSLRWQVESLRQGGAHLASFGKDFVTPRLQYIEFPIHGQVVNRRDWWKSQGQPGPGRCDAPKGARLQALRWGLRGRSEPSTPFRGSNSTDHQASRRNWRSIRLTTSGEWWDSESGNGRPSMLVDRAVEPCRVDW